MLSIVTVCFNNPSELQKTVRSVALQSVPPTNYFVVDSSDEPIRSEMASIAASAGAKYVWVPPEGVYPAMVASVDLVPDDHWVWWVNSSDWLAGKQSVEVVMNAIQRLPLETETHWIIGELLRLQKKAPSVHSIGKTGEEFVQMLFSGKTGFPHPSTIFRKKSLASIAPYSDGLSIASDYSTALRFAKEFGPPALLKSTLSVHNPNGLTARNPVKHLNEKALARIRFINRSGLPREVIRYVRSAVQGAKSRVFRKSNNHRQGASGELTPITENRHFCETTHSPKEAWPGCCDHTLVVKNP